MAKSTFKPAEAKPRKTVDQQVAMSRAIAGYKGGDLADEVKVMVDVPKAFKLTDDSHLVHAYPVGRQPMPKSHAEHFYAAAHGVTPVKE